MDTLPNELLLDILEKIPYDDDETIPALARAYPRFGRLAGSFGHSLAAAIARSQFPLECAIYPQPAEAGPCAPSLDAHRPWLARLSRRRAVADDILGLLSASSIRRHCCPCGLPRWRRLMHAGLLIDYGLQDCDDDRDDGDGAKAAHIRSRPLVALCILYVLLIFCTEAALVLQRGIMHPARGPAEPERRMELCLCFRECCLQHGPAFMLEMLSHRRDHCAACGGAGAADEMLKREWECMDERQHGNPAAGLPPRRTLTSWLKAEIARRTGCAFADVANVSWDVVQRKDVFFGTCSVADLVLASKEEDGEGTTQ